MVIFGFACAQLMAALDCLSDSYSFGDFGFGRRWNAMTGGNPVHGKMDAYDS